MSLNRVEQAVHEYISHHPEERHFIQDKVRSLSTGAEGAPLAVARIDAMLWRYFEERSAIVPAFREDVRVHGARRMSMKNLAELFIRLWTEPKPKKPPAQQG